MQKNLDLIPRVTTRTEMRSNLWPCTSASNQNRTTGFMFAISKMLSDYNTPSPWMIVALKFLLSFVSVVTASRHKIRFHLLKDFLPGILQTSCFLMLCCALWLPPLERVAIKLFYLFHNTHWNVILGKKSP